MTQDRFHIHASGRAKNPSAWCRSVICESDCSETARRVALFPHRMARRQSPKSEVLGKACDADKTVGVPINFCREHHFGSPSRENTMAVRSVALAIFDQIKTAALSGPAGLAPPRPKQIAPGR